MIIQNHRLVASQSEEQVSFRLDEAGRLLRPEIAVVHYAVTHSALETARVLDALDYVSCHVTIDSAGRVIQQVPFNQVANHAGASNYRGRAGCNAFSLGIEISNPGPLFRLADGSFVDVNRRPWRGGVVEAFHKSGLNRQWRFWAEYSQVELDLCAHIVDLWRAEYGITDVVGHDDVAPGRKSDPGPAFPIDWLRKAVFGETVKTTQA